MIAHGTPAHSACCLPPQLSRARSNRTICRAAHQIDFALFRKLESDGCFRATETPVARTEVRAQYLAIHRKKPERTGPPHPGRYDGPVLEGPSWAGNRPTPRGPGFYRHVPGRTMRGEGASI